tara:strand:+ start:322 stop:486 length:165 start_codon:yes stop_codon:yes gene_type:complete
MKQQEKEHLNFIIIINKGVDMQKIKDFWNDSSNKRKIAIVVAGIVLVIFVIKAI